MINLDMERDQIEGFWINSIEKFSIAHSDVSVSSIGLYACPWAGWITLNVDTVPGRDNCPDFTYVDFESLSFHQWQYEYETYDVLQVQVDGKVEIIDLEQDEEEVFDRIVYEYLLSVIKDPQWLKVTEVLKKMTPFRVGVQMLDSPLAEFWEI